jgi:hypothetical protein
MNPIKGNIIIAEEILRDNSGIDISKFLLASMENDLLDLHLSISQTITSQPQ